MAETLLVEETLASVRAQLLELERIGIDDAFFELGGALPVGTQLVSRLRDALQVELPPRYLFETSTVAGLDERIEAGWRIDLAPSIVTPGLNKLDKERLRKKEGDL